MAALVAAHHNPDLKEVYDRLVAAGKPHRVAIVAVMRKLIVMSDALLRDHREWTPEPPVRRRERRDSFRAATRPAPTPEPAAAACG